MTSSIKFSAWFTSLTCLFFVSNLFIFGLLTLFNPDIAFPDAGIAAAFPIQFFAVRHIAFALPLLYGLIKRDIKILVVMYSIFITMSILDISLLAVYGYSIPILGLIPTIAQLPTLGTVLVGIGVFLLPMGLAINYLSSLRN